MIDRWWWWRRVTRTTTPTWTPVEPVLPTPPCCITPPYGRVLRGCVYNCCGVFCDIKPVPILIKLCCSLPPPSWDLLRLAAARVLCGIDAHTLVVLQKNVGNSVVVAVSSATQRCKQAEHVRVTGQVAAAIKAKRAKLRHRDAANVVSTSSPAGCTLAMVAVQLICALGSTTTIYSGTFVNVYAHFIPATTREASTTVTNVMSKPVGTR